jgi:type I restriction enzyme S subunit
MKPGWTYKKLGEVAEVQNGFAFNSKLFNENGEGNPLIRIRDIKRNCTYTYTTENCPKEFHVENGDLLIGMDGDFNVCMWEGGHAFLNQRVCHIVPSNKVLSRFLYYLLPFPLKLINDKTTFATVKHLSSKQVCNILTPVPSIFEQHRIVERLDAAFAQIDELKANAEKQVNEARALFQRALTEAMEPKEGWEEKTLKDVSTIVGDYGLSISSKPFDGVRYLRITDITDWGDLNDDIVSANVDSDKKQQELEEGDILFARTGATVGKTLVYKKEFGECLFAGYLIRYRLDKNKISPRFMYYVTHSKKYYDWVFVNQEAAAQPNISAKKYNLLPVNYPPLSEQHRIVARLDALSARVRELEEIQKNVITECDNMKQAILRQVFE